MGQYHVIYNLDKKEYLSLGGAKLWEKAHNELAHMALLVLMCNSNNRGGGDLNNPILPKTTRWIDGDLKKYKTPQYIDMYKDKKSTKKEFLKYQNALESIQGRWAGDRILVQGDYAKEGDPSFMPEEVLDEFTSISEVVLQAIVTLVSGDEDGDELIDSCFRYELKRKGIKGA